MHPTSIDRIERRARVSVNDDPSTRSRASASNLVSWSTISIEQP